MAHRRRLRARGRLRGDPLPGDGLLHRGEAAEPGPRVSRGGGSVSRVAVIGAGTMGNGIAHVFAQHNWSVALIDVNAAALEKGLATIRSNLDRQVKKGTLAAEAPAEVLGRISTNGSLEAAAGAELVIEAATERPELKFGI